MLRLELDLGVVGICGGLGRGGGGGGGCGSGGGVVGCVVGGDVTFHLNLWC